MSDEPEVTVTADAWGTVTRTERTATTTVTTVTKKCGCHTQTSMSFGGHVSSGSMSGGHCLRHRPIALLGGAR